MSVTEREQELLTVAEVAELLRISERAVKGRVARDSIPGVVRTENGRAFSPLRFRKADLQAWIAGGVSSESGNA